MAIFIGFYRMNEDYVRENAAKLRSGQSVEEVNREYTAKVRAFPENLPQGCKLIGSYAPWGRVMGDQSPGVIIIETDDPTHAGLIRTYYAGYMLFDFVPYIPVARA